MAHYERAQQALNMQHLQQYYQTLQQHAQQQAVNSAAQSGPERMDEGLCDAAGVCVCFFPSIEEAMNFSCAVDSSIFHG